MAKHGFCKKYKEQLFLSPKHLWLSFGSFGIEWIRKQHFGSIIAFGKNHWKQDAHQGNKPILAGDIALDILLVQMVFLDPPHLDQSCLGATNLHMELDLCNSPFWTAFLVHNDIFTENLSSLGKSCNSTNESWLQQDYWNWLEGTNGKLGLEPMYQCHVGKNIIK